MSSTGESVACVEADFSNGKTVDLKGVKWATAIIAGLGLISSAVVSGVGHANTAAHVASNSLSLHRPFLVSPASDSPQSFPLGLRISSGQWESSALASCRTFLRGINEQPAAHPSLFCTMFVKCRLRFRSEVCRLLLLVSIFSNVVPP
ncbi:hypothetical protein LB505_014118 [Fusarium chuoi]|nr:hypothetical protein LB505_014118 [Fusarium chuoi]